MTSPSKPVNITSPRLGPSTNVEGFPGSFTGTPLGTPDLRALRAQYVAASTPPPNIPPRSGTPVIGTPRNMNIPSRSGTPNIGTPRNLSSSLLPSSDSSPIRLGTGGEGGISARRPSTPQSGHDMLDIDNLPDEEKAKVLRRHLVSKEDRKGDSNEDISKPSVTFVEGSSQNPRREDSEPFPVPYNAPGADVT